MTTDRRTDLELEIARLEKVNLPEHKVIIDAALASHRKELAALEREAEPKVTPLT